MFGGFLLPINIMDNVIFSKTASKLGSYEIIDADWKDDNGLLVILKEKRHFLLFINDSSCLTPSFKLEFPMIRWIDRDKILIANSRNETDIDNIFIMDLNGAIVNSFNGGDGIEDLEVSEEGIWISYFDEGVYGGGISTEGLVLFDFSGKVIFRYYTDLVDCPPIDDCYAICKGKGSSLWLFPYSEFPLLQVYPDSKTVHSYKVPEILHGSNSICIRGNYAYFVGGYKLKDELFYWEIEREKPHLLGKIDGIIRGLSNGQLNHFISISEEFVRLYRVINDEEYNSIL